MGKWVKWKYDGSKEFPETLETYVHVKFDDDFNSEEYHSKPYKVSYWSGDDESIINQWTKTTRGSPVNNWSETTPTCIITHYKVVK